MFAQAYDWFSKKSSDLLLIDQTVTLTACLDAQRQAHQDLDLAIRGHRALKFTKNTDEALINASLSRVTYLENYLNFLTCCEQAFKKNLASLDVTEPRPSGSGTFPHANANSSVIPGEMTLCTLMLNIITSPQTTQDKIIPIFTQCLKAQPTITNQFYQNYLEILFQSTIKNPIANQIAIQMSVVYVNLKLNELETNLAFEVAPLSAVRLFPEYEPIGFAACLIWMRKKGVELNQLVQAGLLHKMVEYHFHTLAERAFHELDLFYGLLGQHPSTKELVIIASRISWDKRGKDNYFSLLGHESLTVCPIEVSDELPAFTRDINNLKSLLTAYPETTFIQIINDLYLNSDDEVDQFLMNHVKQFPTLLSFSLFKQLAENHHDLKKWSALINDDLFEWCLRHDELSILYFLPFKPHWINSLDPTMTTSFLSLIYHNHSDEAQAFETAQLLMCLYQAFESKKSACAKQIFQALFDFSLSHCCLMDDEWIDRTLRRSPYVADCLDGFAASLYQELLDEIQVFFQGPINYGTLTSLKSVWERFSEQLNISLVKKRAKYALPSNEVDFLVCIGQQYAQQATPNWTILLEALELEYRTPEFQQRAFLNMLVQVDARPLLLLITEKLKLTQRMFNNEMRTVLLDAIGIGNIGFVSWCLEESAPDDEMVQRAIATKQWPLIVTWYNQYDFTDFTPDTLGKLLLFAVQSSNIGFLVKLIKLNDTTKTLFTHHLMPRRNHPERMNTIFHESGISASFIEAARLDDPIMLRYLYGLQPLPTRLKAALNQACTGKHYHALAFFESLKKPNPHLSMEVERSLTLAVKTNDRRLVDSLMRFIGNAPTPAMLKKAIEKANKDPLLKEMELYLRQLLSCPSKTQTPTSMRPKLPPIHSMASTGSLAELSVFSSPLLRGPDKVEWGNAASKTAP